MRRASIHLIALLLILAGAAALRIYRIDAQSLWVDEIYTYLSATGHQFREYTAIPQNHLVDRVPSLTEPADALPWYTTLRADPDDVHPPTYGFLNRMWAMIFGWEGWKLRLLAAICSVAAIGLACGAVREWSGAWAAIATAAVMAVAQPQVRMGQEARVYSLVLAVAAAAAWVMARIEKRGVARRRIIALGILCFLLPLLHYFSLTIVATLGGYALIRFRGSVRRKTLMATIIPIVIFVAVWSPVLYRQAHGASAAGTTVFVDASKNHYQETLARLALFPIRSLFEPLPSERNVSMIFAIVCVIPLFLLRKRPEIVIWLFWIPLNLAPALLNDLTHRSWTLEIERYTFFATLGIYALIGCFTELLPRRIGYLIPALALLGCALHLNDTYHEETRKASQNWRRFAEFYHQIARPGDVTVFADASDPSHDSLYFLCLEHYAHPLPGPIALLNQPANAILLEQLAGRGVILVGDGGAAKTYFPGIQITDQKGDPNLGMIVRLNVPGGSKLPGKNQ